MSDVAPAVGFRVGQWTVGVPSGVLKAKEQWPCEGAPTVWSGPKQFISGLQTDFRGFNYSFSGF